MWLLIRVRGFTSGPLVLDESLWDQDVDFETSPSLLRACPECRLPSEFVIPSVYWVEDQGDKDHLIELFKSGVR